MEDGGLMEFNEGYVWVTPEGHGEPTGVVGNWKEV